MNELNAWILQIGDLLFGWLLFFPRDVTLLAVSLGSSAILAIVRRWTTNQDLLRRCAADKKQISVLLKAAKKAKDRDAVQRLRATSGQVGLVQIRQEGRPLLAALVPLVILATWSFFRLDYLPARVDEPIPVTAYFSMSSVDRVVTLVPEPGLEAADGWIQRITAVTNMGPAYGIAKWSIIPKEPISQPLVFRFGTESYAHPFRAGGRTYDPVVVTHDEVLQVTEVKLERYRPLGFVPGIPAIGFAPWLIGYLLIVIPFVPLMKRVLKIY